MAGAALFGLLAAGGDLGTAISSYLVGKAADLFMPLVPQGIAMTAEQFGLRSAVLLGCLFPVLSVIFQVFLRRSIIKQRNNQQMAFSSQKDRVLQHLGCNTLFDSLFDWTLLLQRGLGGSESGNRDAEGGTGDVVEAGVVAELDT
jgi:hypothetical protein